MELLNWSGCGCHRSVPPAVNFSALTKFHPPQKVSHLPVLYHLATLHAIGPLQSQASFPDIDSHFPLFAPTETLLHHDSTPLEAPKAHRGRCGRDAIDSK